MSDRPVRLRIGPSPTGEPHVGTAYIALFNYAFAKKEGGKFILRIEDTDQTRSKPEWEKELLQSLKWLGLDWDEGPDVGGDHGPYRQSERKSIHREHAEILLNNGSAYRCFCTPERLAEARKKQMAEKARLGYDRRCRDLDEATIAKNLQDNLPFTVRLKMPLDGKTVVKDRLRGDVEYSNEEVDDQVLLKSDGFPTYHLANVVDDHLMGISHVIRAEEWITSTPKHVRLYEAFGWEAPQWIHMPLLRNQNKSKIAKRKNPVSLLDYKVRGFTPEVVLNFLGTMGYSMPDSFKPDNESERELFSLQEFIAHFDVDRVSLGGPVFDLVKMSNMMGKYLRTYEDEAITDLLTEQLFSKDYIRKIVPLMKERIDIADQFVERAAFFFTGSVLFDPAAYTANKRLKKREVAEIAGILECYVEKVDTQIDFGHEALEATSRAFVEAEAAALEKIPEADRPKAWKIGEVFMAIRIAVTGRSDTPPLFETMAVLGRARVRRRLRDAIRELHALAKAQNKK